MEDPDSNKKKQIKSFIKSRYNLELSDAEIQEISISLYYFAKAKIRYNKIKNGLVKPSSKGVSDD